MRKLRTSFLALLLVFTFALTGAQAHVIGTAQPPSSHTNVPVHGDEAEDFLLDQEAVTAPLVDPYEWNGIADPTASCSLAPRLTALSQASGDTGGNKVVFIYITPSDIGTPTATVTDRSFDRPKFCSNGAWSASPLDLGYRDISTWMAKNLASTTFGSRRYTPVLHRYTNPYTGWSGTFNAVFYFRSTQNSAYWNDLTASQKLSQVRSELTSPLNTAMGFGQSNHVYATVVAARSKDLNDKALGVAYTNGAGTSLGYSMVVGQWRSSSGAPYDIVFGCSNYNADAAMAHEITHVLGAVPSATDGYSAGGGMDPKFQGHMPIVSPHDALEPWLTGPFHINGQSAAYNIAYDEGAENYKATVLNKAWDTTGYSASTAYRTC